MAVESPSPPDGNVKRAAIGRSSPDGLTQRERQFVSVFVALGESSAGEAARRCGYSYPDRTGPRILKRAVIQAELKRKRKVIEAMSEVTVAKTVQELALSAFADIRKLFRESKPSDSDLDALVPGRKLYEMIPVAELPEDIARAVSEVTVESMADGLILKTKVKLNSKLEALDKIMRHLGGYAKDKDVRVTLSYEAMTPEQRAEERMRIAERLAEVKAQTRGAPTGSTIQ